MATVPRAVIITAAASKQRKRYLYARKRQARLEFLIPLGCKILLNYKEAITILGKVLFKQT